MRVLFAEKKKEAKVIGTEMALATSSELVQVGKPWSSQGKDMLDLQSS